MIELTEEQQQAVANSEPVRATLNGREIILLRSDVFRRIQGTLEVERAVIEAGHTRSRIIAPARLEAIESLSGDLGDVALLPVDRYDEIRELVEDDRLRSSWTRAVMVAQSKSAVENL